MDILTQHNSPDVIAAKTAAVCAAMLANSIHIKQPNFERIGVDDLDHMFGLYDGLFFEGWLRTAVKAKTSHPLTFRLSSTMTRAGGKIIQHRRGPSAADCRYEIAIASRMLFMTFGNIRRPVTIGGLTCDDRLSALQRILEHEIIHLAELLAWGQTSCSGPRFRKLALSIFGHTGTTHTLVTVHEHAATEHGIHLGDMVTFEIEGRRLIGRVNRIHRRATVLVRDADGRPYSDGFKYRTFYVPLAMLGSVEMGERQSG